MTTNPHRKTLETPISQKLVKHGYRGTEGTLHESMQKTGAIFNVKGKVTFVATPRYTGFGYKVTEIKNDFNFAETMAVGAFVEILVYNEINRAYWNALNIGEQVVLIIAHYERRNCLADLTQGRKGAGPHFNVTRLDRV